MFRWWYVAIAGGVIAFILAGWLILRRRCTGAPPAPPPSFMPSGRHPSPDSWLLAPGSPTPGLPDSRTPRLPDFPTSSPAKPRARTQYAAAFHAPALLIAKAGPFVGKTFRIERTDFWVGAAENNNLQLDDETVSGNHAFFRFEAETLKVFDNHSTNDTWVNRQAIGETARILFPGDEIQIGRSVFVVERAPNDTPKNVAQPGPPFALS